MSAHVRGILLPLRAKPPPRKYKCICGLDKAEKIYIADFIITQRRIIPLVK